MSAATIARNRLVAGEDADGGGSDSSGSDSVFFSKGAPVPPVCLAMGRACATVSVFALPHLAALGCGVRSGGID